MSLTLSQTVARHIDQQGGRDGFYGTAVKGLSLMRSTSETLPHPHHYQPALCLVLQGAKRLTLGEKAFDYREGQALLVRVQMPGFGSVTLASRASPFLGLILDLDVAVLREVLDTFAAPPTADSDGGAGVLIDPLTEPVADCVTRLVRMLDRPSGIPALYPAIMRELSYWLLAGPQGGLIRQLAMPSGQALRIGEAISLMRHETGRSLRTEELANAAGMSLSSFHHHFKAHTSTSPLQYQKQLRLLEARRLLVSEAANVASAAYDVGYESVSQFSREYSRMFGAPPKRDAKFVRNPIPQRAQVRPTTAGAPVMQDNT